MMFAIELSGWWILVAALGYAFAVALVLLVALSWFRK